MITPAVAAEKILATMGEALFLVRPDGRITTANEVAEKLLGYSGEDLKEMPLAKLFAGGVDESETLVEAAGNGGAQGKHLDLRKRSGEPVPVLFSSAPLLDDHGDMIGMVCIARDISELRSAEEDRRNLMKMQERDEVCRWLHDHLGADLYNISLLAELSRGRTDVDTTLMRQLEWINETSKEALHSIRSYLDFANMSNLTLSDLVRRMEEYGRLLLQSSGVSFSCRWTFAGKDPVLSPLKGLSVFLIFKEAVTNILKHANAGKVHAVLVNGESSFRLQIEDDGVGYVPGRTVTAGHQGIRNISTWADKAGGELSVHPAPEGGTVVNLAVPH